MNNLGLVVVVPSVLNKNMVGHKNIKAEAWEGRLSKEVVMVVVTAAI